MAGGAEPISVTSTLDDSKGESALVVEHLTKRFGDRVAFDEVSFEVGYGEVFGFLGPNGAGKTTTVRSLGTLIAPTSGSAIVAGIPLSPKNGPAIRSRISIMPESPGLYLRLTVLENLHCFAGLYELDDVRGRIGRALRAVNLEDRARDLCGSLSKGLRQRKQLFRRSVDVRLRAPIDDPKAVFGTLPEIEGWEQTPSGYSLTVSDPDLAAPALARALVGADADILSISESRHSLEDVYLELIDEDVEAKSR